MALKDLEKIIADTKKAFGQELSDRLTKAVQARDVRAKADKETNASDKTCPREVQAVFDAALSAEMTKVQRDHRTCPVCPTCAARRRASGGSPRPRPAPPSPGGTRGGASHGAEEGQTVSGITETHRGSGA
jgi:hypothetical protein